MRAFTERFPAESGYRLFLLDTPAGAQEAVRLELNERLANFGFDATPSASRLRELGAVENTYLAVFLALGGLGLLLGSAGVGIVVLRNVTERRGELGMLAAVGYRLPVLRRMLWLEHGLLLAVGLACGTLAAAVAIIPAFRYGADAVPLRGIVLTFAGIAAAGAAWTWLAAWAASRGDLIGGLRSE
jgi:ABC-type antimicrobial peptide transport system permease subunit